MLDDLWYEILYNNPIRHLWHWWAHRNETPAAREERIAASRKRSRELYRQAMKELEDLPESRNMMEWRRELDKTIEDIFGKDDN